MRLSEAGTVAECSECGEQVSMPFTCKFCGEKFCSSHRLPENHDCGGLEEYKSQHREESSEVTYDAQREERRRREQVESQRGLFERLKLKLRSYRFRLDRFLNGGTTHGHQQSSPFSGALTNSFPEIGTFSLLGVIFVAFLLQQIIPGFTQLFELRPFSLFSEPWRIVTNMFLHAPSTSIHLLVNALVLYMFGTELERRIGTRSFLKLFFLAGLIASIGFAGFVHLTVPAVEQCAVNQCAAVGASGAIYGIFAALAIMAPEITVLAFFIIPLRIRSALIGFALFDVFLLTQNTPIASAAHLAGMVVGLYYGFQYRDRVKQRVQTMW